MRGNLNYTKTSINQNIHPTSRVKQAIATSNYCYALEARTNNPIKSQENQNLELFNIPYNRKSPPVGWGGWVLTSTNLP